MRRRLTVSSFVLMASVLAPAATYAQQQSVNFTLGGFVPRAEDARTDGDVLVNNLNFLSFRLDDFHTGAFGGEWQFPLNRVFDASLGVGFTSQSVPSVYSDFVENDGTEIEQNLKVRIVPFTAAVRFLPLGHDTPIQPYIGAGVGIFGWRYSESGEWVDFSDGSISRNTYEASGATAGPVILGGVAFQGRSFGAGGEIRWQSAQGELPADQFFSGDKIDLGGFTYNATFKIRF